jgi:hypothetical protein
MDEGDMVVSIAKLPEAEPAEENGEDPLAEGTEPPAGSEPTEG